MAVKTAQPGSLQALSTHSENTICICSVCFQVAGVLSWSRYNLHAPLHSILHMSHCSAKWGEKKIIFKCKRVAHLLFPLFSRSHDAPTTWKYRM